VDRRSRGNARLAESLPVDGATAVPVDAFVALRLSTHMRVETLNTQTVTLSNPYGPVEVRVVPAEAGRLAFVTPLSPLLPGLIHTLSISGAKDTAGVELPLTTLTFSTAIAGQPAESLNPEPAGPWLPDANYLQSDSNRSQSDSSWQKLSPLQAPAGVTALAGQILKLDGEPLPNVTIQIDEAATRSDASGRFLLSPLKAGRQVMIIHGHTANKPGKTYGMFEVGVDLKASSTTALSYTIWMPVIDNQHAAPLSVPTSKRVTINNPLIPDLEVNIPQNARLRNADGDMRTFSITPIPPDRPPFPGPKGGKVFFVLQTHGARVESMSGVLTEGAEIVFPNVVNGAPGSRVDLYSYNAKTGWRVYGQGVVTANAKRIKPDPGVTPQTLGCVWGVGNVTDAPAEGPPAGSCVVDGDPVDLATGLFVLSEADMALPDVMPIALARTYRPRDTVSRPFGIGATHSYQTYLVGSGAPYDGTELVLADGGRIRYDRISPGTGVIDAVLEHTSTPTQFYKSRLTWNQDYGWDLTFKDGSRWKFQAYANTAPMLIAVSDRNGNTISITRTSQKQVSKVMSPNGRWIELTYDSSDRITQARDNIGRTVGYTYDASGRLWKVTDRMNGVTEYTEGERELLL
jgi:YD repeat-containing protein